MIGLQTQIASDAIATLDWGWLNHEIPLWVTLIFAFTKPYMWSTKLSTITSNVLGMTNNSTTNENE